MILATSATAAAVWADTSGKCEQYSVHFDGIHCLKYEDYNILYKIVCVLSCMSHV